MDPNPRLLKMDPKPRLLKKAFMEVGQFFRSLARKLSLMLMGKKPEILFEGDSDYSHVVVSEIDGIRTMYMGPDGHEAETSISILNPEAPIFEYPGMLFLSLALRPKARRIVMVGLGGGYVPRLCQNYLPNHRLTVVEIDPLVVELACVYFGFSPGRNVDVEIADGLDYLDKLPPSSLDLLWLDAFNGMYIPPHLATVDFLRLTRRVLTEDGLLAQNLHQTMSDFYRTQLAQTAKIFDEPSLIFKGFRCANSIVISPNGPNPIPRKPYELREAVEAFGLSVGPYNLLAETEKQSIFPKAF
jgi:spermidine synthase